MSAAVIIEDDVLAAMALAQLLEGEGFQVRSFTTTDEAFESCISNPPDVLIADWCVPGAISTAELVANLRERAPRVRVIFVSGYETSELQAMVTAEGDVEYLSKPIHFDRFINDVLNYPERNAAS